MARWGSAGLLMVALFCALRGGGLYAKAWLAQELVAGAWQRTLATGEPQPPWPWADTQPVARLRVPRLEKEAFVLAGSHGRTLAFGPGYVEGSTRPGAVGNTVVGGHRDTHFAFLQHLQLGDGIELQTGMGATVSYRVRELLVVHRDHVALMDDFGDRRLTLVTCYPFEAVLPGGPLRYVVIAVVAKT